MATRRTKLDLEKQRYWLALIKRWQASGMTQMAFCKQEGISDKQFYYWYRQLRRRKLIDELPTAQISKPSQAPSFVPVVVKPAVQASKAAAFTLEITTPAGYVLRIP